MSADSWTKCPRCAATRAAELEKRFAALQEAYGRVSIAEFDDMRADLESRAEAGLEETFREDYEIFGADEGEVTVEYSGNCRKCGLSMEFKHTVPVPVADAASVKS